MSDVVNTSELFGEPLDALRATIYLAGRVRATTPRGAALFLELGREGYDMMVQAGINISFLYEEVFPEAYRRSARPLYTHEREFEFYHLLNKRKFPIDLRPLYKHPQFIYPVIPIRCMQKIDWTIGDGSSFESWPTAYQIVIALCNTFLKRDWWPKFARLYNLPLEMRPRHWEEVSVERFTQACLDEPAFRLLPQAFAIVCYRSGNLFLDAHPLSPTYEDLDLRFEWNKENIDALAEHWKLAKQMLTAVLAESIYLQQHPEQIARVIEIWNQSSGEWEF
jgi:hypothetical protein